MEIITPTHVFRKDHRDPSPGCRRRHRLKGIHSRSDTSRTGAGGLSFYYPRLLHCLNQMLAVVIKPASSFVIQNLQTPVSSPAYIALPLTYNYLVNLLFFVLLNLPGPPLLLTLSYTNFLLHALVMTHYPRGGQPAAHWRVSDGALQLGKIFQMTNVPQFISSYITGGLPVADCALISNVELFFFLENSLVSEEK